MPAKHFKKLYSFLTFKSLVARFWWTLFALSLVATTIYATLVAEVWGSYVSSRNQIASWDLAYHLSQQIPHSMFEEQNTFALQKELASLSQLSPTSDLYVYYPLSNLLISKESHSNTELDTGPLVEFTGRKSFPRKAIRIPIARLEVTKDYVFSAQKIKLSASEHAFLIVILNGKPYQEAANLVAFHHIALLAKYLFGTAFFIGSIVILLIVILVPKRMTAIVKAFRRRDYSERIGDKSPDKIGEYARAFDQMANTIVNNAQDIENKDLARRQLVENVSHELRRPLTALNLSLETLKDQQKANNSKANNVDQSLECSDDLSQLVDDLFELSKIEARESSLKLKLFCLRELAEECIARLQATAKDRTLILKVPIEKAPFEVRADKNLIKRAIFNLLENAIRHTDSKGRIECILRPTHIGLEVKVRDDGPGIAKHELPRIFEHSFQGNTVTLRENSPHFAERSGAGLGLAIAQRIIELHNSTLHVACEFGEGTEFYFTLQDN